MKSIVLSIVMAIGIGLSAIPTRGHEGNSDNNNKNKAVKSNIQKLNNKLYFNLKISDDTEKGFYVLLKFTDETNSFPVSVKESISTTPGVELLYSFVDENVPLSDTHYEIVKITEKGQNIVLNYTYSSEATVSSEEN